MNSTKSILLSKTFWGSILALIASVDPSLYARILAWVGINDPNLLSAKVVGLIGAALAIYGRMAATQRVTLTGSSNTTTPPGFTAIPPAR